MSYENESEIQVFFSGEVFDETYSEQLRIKRVNFSIGLFNTADQEFH